RHVDALRAREASELLVPVAEVDLDAEGAGRAGDLVRRDAGEYEGVHVDEQALEGLVRAVPRQRAREVLQLDQVLEDAGRRLRERQERLHGLHEVAAGLDTAQGLRSRPFAGKRRRVAAFAWRHPWLKAALLLTPPLGAFALFYLSSLVALFVSAFWSVNSFTGELQHIWTFGNFKTLFETAAYRTIALRTIGVAAAVTLTAAILAFPFGYFI